MKVYFCLNIFFILQICFASVDPDIDAPPRKIKPSSRDFMGHDFEDMRPIPGESSEERKERLKTYSSRMRPQPGESSEEHRERLKKSMGSSMHPRFNPDETPEERRERMRTHMENLKLNPNDRAGGMEMEDHEAMRERMEQHKRDNPPRDPVEVQHENHQRQKERLTKRRADYHAKLKAAGFTEEERAVIEKKIDDYFTFEEENNNQRLHHHLKTHTTDLSVLSKEEKEVAKSEKMQNTQTRKVNIKKAREMQKEIDGMIKEKMAKNSARGDMRE